MPALAAAMVVDARMKPLITATSPADGEAAVHPAREIRATFDRGVTPDRISVAMFSDAGRPVPTSFSLDWRDHQIDIRTAAPLAWRTGYRLCVTARRYAVPIFAEALAFVLGDARCTQFATMDMPQRPRPSAASILVATGDREPLASYYGPILKAEGFNLFTEIAIDGLDAGSLAGRQVVLIAGGTVPRVALEPLRDWVEAGGLLVAMRPGPELLPLMGLRPASDSRQRSKLYVTSGDSVASASAMAGEMLRIHGDVDFLDLVEAQTASADADAPEPAAVIARLAGSDEVLRYPAVTARPVGDGVAVAFAYDLARSVALTRQGNPRWKNEERDGSLPRRPNDLIYPDFVDVERLAIPQADEQQRLLANLMATESPAPLPRYWYLPQNRRAAVVMIGDDHATLAGTSTLFQAMDRLSPSGCKLEDWSCLRATALLTPRKVFDGKDALRFSRLGFELGAHVDTACRNESRPRLQRTLARQLAAFQAKYPMLPPQLTSRTHCLTWNGWVNPARIEADNGIGIDFNYYHWSPEWLSGHSGFMTGSGFPMPFIDENGGLLPIYQAETHLVNEDGAAQRQGIAQMLERALDDRQFFGAFGTHFDYSDGYSRLLIEEARKRGVALISAAQLLRWKQGRDASGFTNLFWDAGTLTFNQEVAPGAEEADVMLPYRRNGKQFATVSCSGVELDVTRETIKGVDYAVFPARTGICAAHYRRE